MAAAEFSPEFLTKRRWCIYSCTPQTRRLHVDLHVQAYTLKNIVSKISRRSRDRIMRSTRMGPRTAVYSAMHAPLVFAILTIARRPSGRFLQSRPYKYICSLRCTSEAVREKEIRGFEIIAWVSILCMDAKHVQLLACCNGFRGPSNEQCKSICARRQLVRWAWVLLCASIWMDRSLLPLVATDANGFHVRELFPWCDAQHWRGKGLFGSSYSASSCPTMSNETSISSYDMLVPESGVRTLARKPASNSRYVRSFTETCQRCQKSNLGWVK
jgi:hypothetical protein